MSESKVPVHRKRGSLFGPILLIALGVIFLLNNIGALEGDLGGLILQFWPVILIAIGLDNLYQREGLVGAIFMIGLGVVFLLSNLGYINIDVWRLVLNLWPLLLVAIGLDLVLGRRSIWASLVGLLLLLALLAGALWMFGVTIETGQSLPGEQIQQELGEASSAQIILDNGAGDVFVHSMDDPALLVSGKVVSQGGIETIQEYSLNGNRGIYRLRQSGATIGFRIGSEERTWDVGVTGAIPLEIRLNQGAGRSTLELRKLNVDRLDVSTGVGQVRVVLPETGGMRGKINAAIGQIVIEVPKGIGLRFRSGVALGNVNTPPGYGKSDRVYTSPDYEQAQVKIELEADLAIGNITIREID